MGMISICDGCGKQEPAINGNGSWFKPNLWYERTPLNEDGDQQKTITACSRECTDIIEEKRKKDGKSTTKVVLPF